MLSRLLILLSLVTFPLVAAYGEERASLSDLLTRGERLAARKDFREAERVYAEALARYPGSREARLGLGRVFLWSARYDDASRTFRELLHINPGDVEARAGLASSYYWSGDYRLAAREFSRVLELQPRHEQARRDLAGIRAVSRPGFRVSSSYISDDQPYRLGRLETSAYVFSDPLTRWDLAAGSYGLGAVAPYVRLAGETVLPRLRLRLAGTAQLIRFPDDDTKLLGGVELTRDLDSPQSRLVFRVRQSEILRAVASATSHPYETAVDLRYHLTRPSGFELSWTAGRRSYFDHNSGTYAEGYLIVPAGQVAGFALLAGASAAYQDTEEPRSRLIRARSRASGSGVFLYRYDGAYDPYFTPHELLEGRLVASAATKLGSRVSVSIYANAGVARDRAIAFGPPSGTDPQPPLTDPLFVSRTFYPWRVQATLDLSLSPVLSMNVELERFVTVYYRANEVRASLAGRF